jgi:transcriptional regulator with XRE-family HTH domain
MRSNIQIGSKIKNLRVDKNMSQKRFGAKLGLTGKTISAYETGKSTPPLKVLENISQIYDMPFFVSGKEQKNALKSKLQTLKNILDELTSLLEKDIPEQESLTL